MTTRPSPQIRRFGRVLAAVGFVVLAAACTSISSTATPQPTAAPTTTAAPAASVAPLPGCGDKPGELPAVASFAPDAPLPAPGNMPAGSYMEEIFNKGQLKVGASADTFHMGYRNPFTGEIEGFDIDQLHRVAQAIFGDPNKIEFKIVTYAQRIPALNAENPDDRVDIVAHSMTINCTRWNQIDFSSEYLTAGQKVLVRTDSKAVSIEDLGGQRVCTQNGTTSIERLKTDYPDIEIVAVDDVSECLVKFQLGEADAISGDDTVLAGFVAQDPYAKVLPDKFSSEPYGMGINKDHPEFVRFVNAVLAKSRTDGSWEQSYKDWLSTDGTAPAPPAAVYGREP